jgi:hypothetical protein
VQNEDPFTTHESLYVCHSANQTRQYKTARDYFVQLTYEVTGYLLQRPRQLRFAPKQRKQSEGESNPCFLGGRLSRVVQLDTYL